MRQCIFRVFICLCIELDVKTNLQKWGLLKACCGALLPVHPAFLSKKTRIRMMSTHCPHEVRMQGRALFPLEPTRLYRPIWRGLCCNVGFSCLIQNIHFIFFKYFKVTQSIQLLPGCLASKKGSCSQF